MAYAAAVSLKDILKQLYSFSDGYLNIDCPESYLKCLHDMAVSIQAFDFEENSPVGKSLDKEIRDALWRAEDIVESYLLNHFISLENIVDSSRDMSTHTSKFSRDLMQVMLEINLGMKKMYVLARYLSICKENSCSFAASDSSSSDGSSLCQNKMVGLDWELEDIKRIIFNVIAQRFPVAFVLHGMGGIGKTSLAKCFYHDSDVRNYFTIGAWINISLEHCVRDVLVGLLRTVEVFGVGTLTSRGLTIDENDTEEGLAYLVREIFVPNRYLVIVDCLCEMNKRSWDYIKSLLPTSNNGSRIMLVNRMKFDDDDFVYFNYPKWFLDASQSWNLLKEKVFGDEPCSFALERIGKKIARKCQGLPLAIVTVGLHLAKEQKTVEYWNKVADSGNSIAYKVDGESMFEQLGLSYKQMPQHFRPIFLYMGTFLESYDIPDSELHGLWLAEGLVEWEQNRDVALFNYLSSRNLAIIMQGGENSVLTYSLYHAMWHFCGNKAEEDEFFHVMDKHSDLEDSTPSVNFSKLRRLVVRKNVLFAIKNTSLLSNVRSLLFNGLYHPYPLQIFWGRYKMLKVLNACSIRFYEFPSEILCLGLLRYLALTLNRGNLPSGISKLRNLQFLIVRLHQIVKSIEGVPTYLPQEIWEMRQLLHLECTGSDLPLPPHSGTSLPLLSTLSGVTHHSCTKEVLERIPNLMHCIINVNLAPESDATIPLSSPFNHLPRLQKLKWLNCVITNPYFESYPSRPHLIAMPESVSVSMNSLTRLVLSGCGFPWESIQQISKLPFLGSLKLQCHAFRGPKWKLTDKGFKQLKSLVLEDLDLVYWTARSGDNFFPCLRDLTITRCHKLQEIPLELANCSDLIMVRIVDSTRQVETWAQKIQTERSQTGGCLVLEIHNLRGESTCTI